MHWTALTCIAFSFLAVMRKSTCIEPPTYTRVDSSVFIGGCIGEEYYELDDDGCIKLNESSDDVILIGTDGPDVEGLYCCDDTCNQCTNYSSTDFITVHKTNVTLNASASQGFILEIKEYTSIGKVSREQLTELNFVISGKENDYDCDFYSSQCVGDNFSINRTSYALNIFRIDPNIPAFNITTFFTKYVEKETTFVMDKGPTFYIRVQPTVTLTIDNASNIVTCNVETSLPAALKVLINNESVTNLPINSTSFSHDRYLSPGEHLLECEATNKLPDGVTLTTSESQLYYIPFPSTSTSPTGILTPSVSTPLPTTPSTPSPYTLPSVVGGVIMVVIFVTIAVIVVVIVLVKKRRSPDSNVEQ